MRSRPFSSSALDAALGVALGTVLAAGVTPARAQVAGPIALLVPVSARSAALGNAWVAGRDEYAVFSNPAQLSASNGFGFTFGTYGGNASTLAAAAGETVGPYTFGFGVHLVDFSASRANTDYPYAPAALAGTGNADLFSMVALVAAQRTFARFKIGVAAKYAEDLVPTEAASNGLLVVPTRGHAVLGDLGVSHALWTGTAGLSFQNIGQPYLLGPTRFSVPTQLSLGWTVQKQWGPLDIAYATQVTGRRGGWVSPAAGVEVGWSWIEGYSIGGRVGARRTETSDEHPVGVGASVNADRLNIEYGVNFFTGNIAAQRITLRWR